MLPPLSLIVVAVALAAAMAYGTDAGLIHLPHGLALIMLARRIQWLLAAASILSSIALLVLVISARRRVFWLLGLAPVLALFIHRYATADINKLSIVDAPTFVTVDIATFLKDDDYVVGVIFQDQPYAYPYAALYRAPVITQSDGEHRMLLIWNATANAAFATSITQEIRPRELDIVAQPANALLIYNARRGQFINGFTGQTPDGARPQGFSTRLPVRKMPWSDWRRLYPASRVMASPASAVTRPLLPPGSTQTTPAIVVATTQPIAIASLGREPINTRAGETPVLVIRDPATGAPRAFDRRLEPDLAPRFVLNRDPKRKAFLIDRDTNTGWSAGGVAIDGEKSRLGKKLTPIDVQEDIYYGVARYWWPNVTLCIPNHDAQDSSQPAPARHTTASRTRRRR